MRRIRGAVKTLIGLLPATIGLYVSDSLRWLSSARVRSLRRDTNTALSQLGTAPIVIRSGPFAGMRYSGRTIAQGGLIPKVVGCYEHDLHPVIEEIFTAKPALVIDVGAADGYYAVGFALRIPNSRVIAYEMERPLHSAIRSIGRMNGVLNRITIRGRCDPSSLEADLLTDDAVVIVDVEGYEDALLDPERIPALRRVRLLVEVHDAIVPGVGDRLRARFAPSHRITRIVEQRDSGPELPAGLPPLARRLAIDEGRRTAMEWLWAVPSRQPDL